MANDDNERAAALDQLRSELLQFVLEEITFRTTRGGLPDLQGRIAELVDQRAALVATSVLEKAPVPDAKQIATEVAALLMGTDARAIEPKAKTGRSSPGRANLQLKEYPDGTSSGNVLPPPAPHHLRDALLENLPRSIFDWIFLAVGAASLMSAVFLLVLHQSDRKAMQRSYAISSAQREHMTQACTIKRKLDGQAALLLDDKQWRTQCDSSNIAPENRRMCAMQREMQHLLVQYPNGCY
jgi:hypothetical protein